MRKYFEEEMRLLTETAQKFAEQYPTQAAMLNLNNTRQRDPSVERLLEGVAFLTAQVKQKIDDDVPELCETLLEHVAPELLWPFPAATILEFNSVSQRLQNTQLIPTGSYFQTILNNNSANPQPLVFRTTAPLYLQPIKLVNSTIACKQNDEMHLHLHCKINVGVNQHQLISQSIILYLHTETALAVQWFYILINNVKSLSLLSGEQAYSFGDQSNVVSEGITHALLPEVKHQFYLLQDYFNFIEKYLFIEIKNLPLNLIDSNEFILEIVLQNSQFPVFNNRMFRLHCVPAINLYLEESEAIFCDHTKSAYLIKPINNQDNNKKIVAVKEVVGINRIDQRKSIYKNNVNPKFNSSCCYQINRMPHINDTQWYISLENSNVLMSESVNCELLICDGDLAPQLPVHSNFISMENNFLNAVTITNLTQPTLLLQQFEHKYYRWDLLTYLASNLHSLSNLENFKHMLELYNYSRCMVNQKRINAIQSIHLHSSQQINKGVIQQGVKVIFAVSENEYNSIADLYLFFDVIHHTLKNLVALNSFLVTQVNCINSKREFVWLPTPGKQWPF